MRRNPGLNILQILTSGRNHYSHMKVSSCQSNQSLRNHSAQYTSQHNCQLWPIVTQPNWLNPWVMPWNASSYSSNEILACTANLFSTVFLFNGHNFCTDQQANEEQELRPVNRTGMLIQYTGHAELNVLAAVTTTVCECCWVSKPMLHCADKDLGEKVYLVVSELGNIFK